VIAHPITALSEVANIGCGAAHGRALGIGWAGCTCSCTSLGHITDPGCGTALHRGGLEAVGWAGVAHPITALGEVANLGCGAAHGRALGIGWAGGTGTRARLRRVTRTG